MDPGEQDWCKERLDWLACHVDPKLTVPIPQHHVLLPASEIVGLPAHCFTLGQETAQQEFDFTRSQAEVPKSSEKFTALGTLAACSLDLGAVLGRTTCIEVLRLRTHPRMNAVIFGDGGGIIRGAVQAL